MTAIEERVLNQVLFAFRDVRLGDGTGLWQGQVIDEMWIREAQLARDEKQDWAAIPLEDLERCSSSLSFFDADGMRFHLPAYLAMDLRGSFGGFYILFSLTYFEDGNMSKFAKLNDDQRRAVREYLLLRLADPDEEFNRPAIERALQDYWTDEQ